MITAGLHLLVSYFCLFVYYKLLLCGSLWVEYFQQVVLMLISDVAAGVFHQLSEKEKTWMIYCKKCCRTWTLYTYVFGGILMIPYCVIVCTLLMLGYVYFLFILAV